LTAKTRGVSNPLRYLSLWAIASNFSGGLLSLGLSRAVKGFLRLAAPFNPRGEISRPLIARLFARQRAGLFSRDRIFFRKKKSRGQRQTKRGVGIMAWFLNYLPLPRLGPA